MKRISNEEIVFLNMGRKPTEEELKRGVEEVYPNTVRIAQAQLDADRKEVKEILEEISKLAKWTERHYSPGGNVGTPASTGGIINIGDEYLLISKSKLQALKQKHLGDKV